jgi:hypothetical protein
MKVNTGEPTMIRYSKYEQEAINVALSVIHKTLSSYDVMNSPDEVENYLKIKLAPELDELCFSPINII